MWITIISNFFQFLLLGFLVQFGSTHTELRQQHKGKYLTAIALVSLSIFGLASYGAYRQSQWTDALTKAITGGDSFPVVIPQQLSDHADLAISNFGDSVLTGVAVEFSCGPPLAPKKEIIGTMAAHVLQRITTVLDIEQCRDAPPLGDLLVIKGEKVASYWIDLYTQNGTYNELLQFKRGDNCHQWSYRYSVSTRQGVGYRADKTLGIVGDVKELYRVPKAPQDWFGDEKCQ
jgi:hypothetical protein